MIEYIPHRKCDPLLKQPNKLWLDLFIKDEKALDIIQVFVGDDKRSGSLTELDWACLDD